MSQRMTPAIRPESFVMSADLSTVVPDSSLPLSEAEVAKILGIGVPTLRNWRCKGLGPTVVRLTGRRVVYLRSDLAEYFAAHRQQPDGTPLPASGTAAPTLRPRGRGRPPTRP